VRGARVQVVSRRDLHKSLPSIGPHTGSRRVSDHHFEEMLLTDETEAGKVDAKRNAEVPAGKRLAGSGVQCGLVLVDEIFSWSFAMRHLRFCCFVITLLASVDLASACLNDSELPNHEREFRSQYLNQNFTSLEPDRGRPADQHWMLSATGISLLGGAIGLSWFGARKQKSL